MTKTIKLSCVKIKYTGDSIGDDIRLEVEILDRVLRVDKIIKVNTIAEIDREIGRFETDQKLFEADARITVIEKDLLFNDVGSITSSIKIDTNIAKPQQFVYEIKIRETRSVLGKFWGKKIADFEIILEATITDVVRYIPNDDEGKGWLKVRIESNKSIESLPAFLKVRSEYSDSEREYFTPLEGAHRGKLVSAKLQRDGSLNLLSGVQHKPVARAFYSISKKTFTINGKVYATLDYKNALWKKGLYDIEIPDYPHSGGARYEEDVPRAKTWFKIGHNGERYLHAGGRSLGCMTIIEITRWMEIYNALIKARKNDFMSVGELEVID